MMKTNKELILSSMKFTVIILLVTSILYEAWLPSLSLYLGINALDSLLIFVACFVPYSEAEKRKERKR